MRTEYHLRVDVDILFTFLLSSFKRAIEIKVARKLMGLFFFWNDGA